MSIRHTTISDKNLFLLAIEHHHSRTVAVFARYWLSILISSFVTLPSSTSTTRQALLTHRNTSHSTNVLLFDELCSFHIEGRVRLDLRRITTWMSYAFLNLLNIMASLSFHLHFFDINRNSFLDALRNSMSRSITKPIPKSKDRIRLINHLNVSL